MARTRTALEDLAASIRESGGRASVVPADLAQTGGVEGALCRAGAEVGQSTSLAALAGGSIGPPRPVAEIEDDYWEQDVRSNLTTTFATVRAVLPGMTERGRGSVITMASTAARGPVAAPLG